MTTKHSKPCAGLSNVWVPNPGIKIIKAIFYKNSILEGITK